MRRSLGLRQKTKYEFVLNAVRDLVILVNDVRNWAATPCWFVSLRARPTPVLVRLSSSLASSRIGALDVPDLASRSYLRRAMLGIRVGLDDTEACITAVFSLGWTTLFK